MTVALLLTDVEGSTTLWERDRIAMSRAMFLHDFDEPEHVFQLCHPSLRAEFPPLTPPPNVAHVATLADQVRREVSRLGAGAASLALSGQIELADEKQRAAFLEDVRRVFTPLAEKYTPRGGSGTFRIAFVCYPSREGT